MTKEQIIREYYGGWEKRDWSEVAKHLADDFTFTSPYDYHLNTVDYKSRCWRGADSIHKFEFLTIMDSGNQAFARWKCQIGGKMVNNTEYFLFDGDRIKAIEVYFGQLTK